MLSKCTLFFQQLCFCEAAPSPWLPSTKALWRKPCNVVNALGTPRVVNVVPSQHPLVWTASSALLPGANLVERGLPVPMLPLYSRPGAWGARPPGVPSSAHRPGSF